MRWVAFMVVLALGCSATRAPAAKRTLPSPLVAAKLPPAPKDEFKVPPAADWAVGVEGYVLGEGEGQREIVDRPGICMSMEKAERAARYVIRYEELRELYIVDLKTWGREREIYERHLELGQQEIDAWKKEAERSWFERNAGPIGLVTGLILGVAASAIAVDAIDKAAD